MAKLILGTDDATGEKKTLLGHWVEGEEASGFRQEGVKLKALICSASPGGTAPRSLGGRQPAGGDEGHRRRRLWHSRARHPWRQVPQRPGGEAYSADGRSERGSPEPKLNCTLDCRDLSSAFPPDLQESQLRTHPALGGLWGNKGRGDGRQGVLSLRIRGKWGSGGASKG